MSKKVCLFGGTFNPIHNGHIITAFYVQKKFHFDEIIFIPNYLPPHRKAPDISAKHRLKIIELSLKDTPFSLSDIEIKNKGISYFINTVKKFKKKYSDLYMLIGTDQANRFRTWYRWQDFFKLIKIVVVKKDEPLYEILPFFYMEEMEKIPISSRDIREKIRKNECIKGLLADEAIKYIKKNGLYK